MELVSVQLRQGVCHPKAISKHLQHPKRDTAPRHSRLCSPLLSAASPRVTTPKVAASQVSNMDFSATEPPRVLRKD